MPTESCFRARNSSWARTTTCRAGAVNCWSTTGLWHAGGRDWLDLRVRVPLLAGSRLTLVNAPDDAVLLAPPGPLDPIADVGAAVGEALRFPLSGPPLEELATPGGRATVVVEPPSLPLPGAPQDPRRDALAAVLEELERAGMPAHRQTILVAGGLGRRASRAELEVLLRPERAREFRGEVVVHDCEAETLRPLGEEGGVPLRVSSSLLAADLVVTATAAETVLHGGPAALLAAGGPAALRAAGAESLLEPATSSGWRLASALETAVGGSVPLLGISLVLDHPRLEGRLRGYPWSADARERVARSPLRRLLGVLPFSLRRRALQASPRRLDAVAALAGPPSVAHVEALLRGVAVRGARLPVQLDAIVVPTPWTSPRQPREPLNPITASAAALGLALRLWRDRPPLRWGGTVVVLHGFGRAFGHGPQAPYRALFAALRDDRSPGGLEDAERAAATDDRALAAYRAGRAPHPLLPFADWAGCGPALQGAGRVIVGACRDAGAARALGFVPSHSATAAVEMARELGSEGCRLGLLLGPPYPPLVRD